MRPTLRFLSDDLIEKIVTEARGILCTLGVEIQNEKILSMLSDHGARIEKERSHALLTEKIIDKSLQATPHSFKLFDVICYKDIIICQAYRTN